MRSETTKRNMNKRQSVNYQKEDEEEMDSDNLTIQNYNTARPDANLVENQQKAHFGPINKNKETGI